MKAAIIAGCVVLSVSFGASGAHAEPELKEWLAQCKKGDQHACQLVRQATDTEGQWVTYKDWKRRPRYVWRCFGVSDVIAKTRKQADRKCDRAQLEAQKRQDKCIRSGHTGCGE